jgi:hypothetical protein
LEYAEIVSQLSTGERIRLFHLISQGICLHARGLASDESKNQELRLLQSDAIIEMLHRLFEQSEHYYKRTDAQRPEQDLFTLLQHLESMAQLNGMISSAFTFATRNLPEGTTS